MKEVRVEQNKNSKALLSPWISAGELPWKASSIASQGCLKHNSGENSLLDEKWFSKIVTWLSIKIHQMPLFQKFCTSSCFQDHEGTGSKSTTLIRIMKAQPQKWINTKYIMALSPLHEGTGSKSTTLIRIMKAQPQKWINTKYIMALSPLFGGIHKF